MDTTLAFNAEHLNILKLFFLFIFVEMEFVDSAKQKDILSKTCTRDGTFKISFGEPFEKCIEECQRRRRCKFIMYKHGINECSLKDLVNVTALAEKDPICLFAARGDQKRVEVVPCKKISCGFTETCVTSSNDPNSFECVTSECPTPPAVSNAKILSNVHGICQRNRYQCNKNYVGIGEPMITCKNDGTWTTTNFTCSKNETIPAQDLGIADLINVVGEKWVEGTELHFSCKPGYQGLGVYTSAVLTKLSKKFVWSPPTIQCCNENITRFVSDKRCEAVFNASTSTKFGDLQRFCLDIGGSVRSASPDFASTVFDEESYLWLWTNYKKSELHSRLKICFEMKNITDLLENFSNFTYNELIEEIISRNISGHRNCDSARWWAPNEPSGGEDENCMLYERESLKMYDVKCVGWENLSELLNSGFLCDFSLPEISRFINYV